MANTLECKQCGHVNEPQRIYCHECGAKLDRSVLPPEPDRQVTYDEQKKRVQRIARPNSGFFVHWWKSLLNSLAWALVVSSLVLMALPPADVPPMADKDKALEAPQIPFAIEKAIYGPTVERLAMTEEIINLYLQGAIRAKPTGIIADEYKFQRAYVKLDDGGLRIYAHQTVYDYPLYAGLAYTLAIKDGKLDAQNTGGWIGRLPVHPLVTQFADYAFDPLWKALKREHDTLAKVQAIEIAKDPATDKATLTVVAGGRKL